MKTDPFKSQAFHEFKNTHLGEALAGFIVFLWFVSLVEGFSVHLSQADWPFILLGVLARAFLHTGLFIVTHDAIHRNISQHHWLNDMFGYVTSFLYALLPYKVLAKNHRLHHRFPGTEQDPDHGGVEAKGFLPWYVKFMKTYQADGQFWILLTGISVIFYSLTALQVPVANLMLFWIIPIVISSLQLFTFGIYLPHHPGENDYPDGHRASSLNLPAVLSFLTCYHFGYHWEHHQYPYLPWYRLPEVCHAAKTSHPENPKGIKPRMTPTNFAADSHQNVLVNANSSR